jgi:lipoyl-dependent peroxiredoxin
LPDTGQIVPGSTLSQPSTFQIEQGESIMAVRKAEAVWTGTLKEGQGTMKLGSGAYTGAYTFASRFEEEPGSNPEELIGAALAGCFSMFLSSQLTKAGYTPTRIASTARVHLAEGAIHTIELTTEAEVPDVGEEEFNQHAQNSKANCPVSKALAGPEIKLEARLIG